MIDRASVPPRVRRCRLRRRLMRITPFGVVAILLLLAV